MKQKVRNYGLLILLICYSVICNSEHNQIKEVQSSTTCDSILILNKKYKIPDFWRLRKIDTKLQVETGKLVRLPQKFTFKDYNINVTKETYNAFLEMANAAKKDSIDLIVDSGFRSIQYQKKIIEKYYKKGISPEIIFRSVAPPGYSEHMLGSAIDFVPSDWSFSNTEIYSWLKNNAINFGFKQTYMDDIMNEPWHWRYVNNDL